jgi:signal transduction histidine kinase
MMARPRSHFGDFVFSIIGVLSITLILVIVVMRPPLDDMIYLAVLLALTGAASAAIGFFSHRFGLWQRFRSLRQAVAVGYVLAAALTLLNVWITAKLMFVNQHDLALASLLLFFAAGISVGFGYFLGGSVTARLDDLANGAARVSEGDFSTVVDVHGEDEVARLTRMFNDMTARLKQMDTEATALNASRRRLIVGASHDLRTPLSALRAMLDALADEIVTDPETTARYLHQCRVEVQRMSDLIDGLFDLAQLDVGHIILKGEQVSLPDLISDTLASFTARARAKNVALKGSVSQEIDMVWMDAGKINRVLTNLVDNALRHTPSGGSISITAEQQPDSVKVCVIDTGEGIKTADLPYIFDYFYRGEQSRSREGYTTGGAGLGLAIARRMIEAHGGTIATESHPGKGTTMCFMLPGQPIPSSVQDELA